MSLLTRNAPHTVEVQLRDRTKNLQGQYVFTDVGDRIPVRCQLEPVRDWSSAEEQVTLGRLILDLGVIRAKSWPGDINSHVYYQGEQYETVGAPQHYHSSRRTSHFRVTVKWVKSVG